MLRVTIEEVRGAVESARFPIETIEIVQVEKLDNNPEGWRRYAVYRRVDDHPRHGRDPDHLLLHRRERGAAELVDMALSAERCPILDMALSPL